jgi:hypothetical protein
VRAGVSFALQEATDDGHCGLPVESLLTLAVKLLDVDKAIVRTALDHELAGAEVVGDTIGGEPCIFLRGLHTAERGVAERLRSLPKSSSITSISLNQSRTERAKSPSDRNRSSSGRENHSDETRPTRSPRVTSTLWPPLRSRRVSRTCMFMGKISTMGAESLSLGTPPVAENSSALSL